MGYADAPNQTMALADGRTITFRDVGDPGGRPLVLLRHFRGNLDNWDPAVVVLAGARRVITFDNSGVGGSPGFTPPTIAEWHVTSPHSSPRKAKHEGSARGAGRGRARRR